MNSEDYAGYRVTCEIRCLSGGGGENVNGPQQEENEGDMGEGGSGEKANQAPRGAAHFHWREGGVQMHAKEGKA